MERSRSTAERIRPILQAMERSIESARRRRLHDSGLAAAPITVESPQPVTDPTRPPRQKARPKRPSSLMRPYDATEYRAEAV